MISIKKSKSMEIERTNSNLEESVKTNYFDPEKSSPPNTFMAKLYMRMYNYERKTEDNFSKE